MIGLWQPGNYPSTYTLPRPEQLNVVLADHTRQWNKFKRIPWNIYEQPGSAFDATELAGIVQAMQSEPRYLAAAVLGEPVGVSPRTDHASADVSLRTDHASADVSLRTDHASADVRGLTPTGSPPTIAQDVQLQQFIQQFCRCRGTSSLAQHWDRNRSFDVLFREIAARFDRPTIVETGTIRAEEDFGGAGFFTYVAATFLHRHGGTLHSVDLTPQHVAFAREWTAVFGETVQVHHGDSVAFLSNFAAPIDVLYLDSLDTTEPGHADHALRELEAALPKLHDRSLIVIDDTPWQAGAFTGKGARAVPWLLECGWTILYAGYQVVLTR